MLFDGDGARTMLDASADNPVPHDESDGAGALVSHSDGTCADGKIPGAGPRSNTEFEGAGDGEYHVVIEGAGAGSMYEVEGAGELYIAESMEGAGELYSAK